MDQDEFDRLLRWLDPDRDAAGRKYEEIRIRLIRIFVRRGCYEIEVEHLADETISRVAKKLPGIEADYVGDPALYFCGVARNVAREKCRKPPPPPPPPPPDPPDILELYDRCLTSCLKHLSESERKLMLNYFKHEGRAKIEAHEAMANELGISINAIRTRAHRLKKTLKECVLKCIKRDDE